MLTQIKKTEAEIVKALEVCNSKTVDIRCLNEKVNALPCRLRQYTTVCRFCLKFIPRKKIFLYDNKYNILPYSLIKKMLEFCDIDVVRIFLYYKFVVYHQIKD